MTFGKDTCGLGPLYGISDDHITFGISGIRTYVGYVSLLSFDAAADQNMYVHMYLSYQI